LPARRGAGIVEAGMKDPAAQGEDAAVERRLATILMADVFGYSRMMGEDEERTVRIFRGHRAVFDELLKVHRGRIFNTAGDAILAEFPSAVEAVRCATEIQAALRTRNEHLPEAQRMWFRIGINLGDVIIQEGDLLGDGVNVAARIQTVAEPGGVCISGSVYDQIQNKLTLQIKQLGERNFKNIALPVRTFAISSDGTSLAGAGGRPSRKTPMLAIAAVAAAIAVGAASYWLYRDHNQRAAEDAQRAEETRRGAEAQRKAELERSAAAAAQKEAKLVAELQSAREALTLAEASKRKAEQDRFAAEASQREARIQSDLKAAREALQKAEQSEKNADEARKAAALAMQTADAAARKAVEVERQAAASAAQNAAGKIEAEPKSPAPPQRAVAANSTSAKDGTYVGRMCSTNSDGTARCWGVGLIVDRGSLSATWPTRFNNEPAHAKGSISADGSVRLTLDGYTQSGRALTGTMSGRLADGKISTSGSWSNRVPVDANWVVTQ